jgi:hypothetical protein
MSKSTHKQVALFGWGSPSQRRRRRASREKALIWWYGPAVVIAVCVGVAAVVVVDAISSAVRTPDPTWFMVAIPILAPALLLASYTRDPERIHRALRASVRRRKDRPREWVVWQAAHILILAVIVLWAIVNTHLPVRVFWAVLALQGSGSLVLLNWVAFSWTPTRPISRAAPA